MGRISLHILRDLIRSKAILAYFLVLSLLGWGVFLIESHPQKALLTLMQVSLLLLPMMTMIFAAIYYYNALEFILLLLAQPIRRATILWGFYAGLASAFTLAFLAGIGLPLMLFFPVAGSFLLLCGGILLSLIFTALALLIATHIQDKARGLGAALLAWAFFAFIFDGLLLLLMYQFSDYPIERPVLFLTLLNPVDTTRILIIMQTEASALMGLSGVLFQRFFGTAYAWLAAFGSLSIWVVLPLLFTLRKFRRKDL